MGADGATKCGRIAADELTWANQKARCISGSDKFKGLKLIKGRYQPTNMAKPPHFRINNKESGARSK